MGAALALAAVDEGAHIEEALAEYLPSGRDRGLGWYLALGTLRRRGEVDGALRAHLRQPLSMVEPGVCAVLRLATFEKLFARAEDHAVVHQAVEVVRAVGLGRASGLVNAVVRKVAPAELTGAESMNMPAWLWERWKARYGEEAAAAWCRMNIEQPPLTVVLREESDRVTLEEAGCVLSPAEVHGQRLDRAYSVVGTEGQITELPGFEEGRFWVQDAAAVAVADFVGPVEGRSVLDACAAPGGKSFRIASRGGEVTAVDRDRMRLKKVRRGGRRLGIALDTVIHDWAAGPSTLEQFDIVLVDAPCSGLGTLRRHPEIKWRRQQADLARASDLQRRILQGASAHVKPGGTLVYAVCSPEPEEGEAVVQALLAADSTFRLEATLSTAPPSAGEDAHFAARLVRE